MPPAHCRARFLEREVWTDQGLCAGVALEFGHDLPTVLEFQRTNRKRMMYSTSGKYNRPGIFRWASTSEDLPSRRLYQQLPTALDSVKYFRTSSILP